MEETRGDDQGSDDTRARLLTVHVQGTSQQTGSNFLAKLSMSTSMAPAGMVKNTVLEESFVAVGLSWRRRRKMDMHGIGLPKFCSKYMMCSTWALGSKALGFCFLHHILTI